MKSMAIGLLCLGAATAWANDEETPNGEVPEVSTRLEMIEVINVTAEKPPGEHSDTLDAELEAILDEAEALEADEE